MGNYLTHFVVYMLAMSGFIMMALYVYKKATMNKNPMANDMLSIENRINLSPRKSLYIIKAGNEKFLIASDVENTTFLAKLEDNKDCKQEIKNVQRTTEIQSAKVTKLPVMQELLKKMSIEQRG